MDGRCSGNKTLHLTVHQPSLPVPNYAIAVAKFNLTARDQSLTSSILSAGTFFGAIMAGDVAGFVGRRVAITAGCFIFSIGCVLETASTGRPVTVFGRVIAGFGVGFISAIVILYMSESKLDLYLRLPLWVAFGHGFTKAKPLREFPPRKSAARSWLVINSVSQSVFFWQIVSATLLRIVTKLGLIGFRLQFSSCRL